MRKFAFRVWMVSSAILFIVLQLPGFALAGTSRTSIPSGSLASHSVSGTTSERITLRNHAVRVELNPATLEMTMTPEGGGSTLQISVPQTATQGISVTNKTEQETAWLDPVRGFHATVRLDGNSVVIEFIRKTPGWFTWPVVHPSDKNAVYLLPIGMGNYVPANDAAWANYLADKSPMSTTEGLSMPFVAIHTGRHIITWLFENEYHNSIAFAPTHSGLLKFRAEHETTRLDPGERHAVRVTVGPDDLVEPARLYREWLRGRGELVTLRDKIARNPSVAKLLGAAHVYIWGADPVTFNDVIDWKGLIVDFRKALYSPDYLGRTFLDRMTQAERKDLNTLVTEQWPSRYGKTQLLRALNRILLDKPLSKSTVAARPTSTRDDIPSSPSFLHSLNASQIRANCHFLSHSFPGRFRPVEDWGGAFSRRAIRHLRDAGIDRLFIGLPSWMEGLAHPEAVEAAVDAGYLVAPYDSYHSIHRPGRKNTWETAQFDEDLYRRGTILRADGKPRSGFKGIGCLLSPLAAMPYVHRRIRALETQVPFNAWFFDCDAFGQVFDNYSAAFPQTQRQGAEARLARMRWAAKEFGLVVGSEGGSAYAEPVIDFAHGLMTPGFGWGDKDLYSNKSSPYYLGRYYPPEAPERFFKSIPLKPVYRRFTFDPRYRLPLFPVALGDSVIATHQWGFPSTKFSDEATTIRLTELLYGVPPLVHLATDGFSKQVASLAAYFRVFSPLHRTPDSLAMTDFRYVTKDRLVQQSTFGKAVRVTINFRSAPFSLGGKTIPPESARIERLEERKMLPYSPGR